MSAFTTIVSAADVAAHRGDADWVVVDCRHDLADPASGEAAYRAGHIPGAVFLHLDRDLSGPTTGRNGRHPLPDPLRLAERLAECGIDNDSQIVAYDDHGGMYAGRLWGLMRWLGHRRVAVLDGGLAAWCEAGGRLDAGVTHPQPSRYGYRLGTQMLDVDWVQAHRGDADVLLVDARSPDRYRGENETLDPVGGHIPGALNRFFKLNLDERGRFKPAAQLRAEWLALLAAREPRAVVHTCGSGVTACHNWLAMEIAGLPGSRLYAGSWSEWCADPARPVATDAR